MFNEFEKYLLETRNLAESSALHYKRKARRFLYSFGDPWDATPEDVKRWVHDHGKSVKDFNSWVATIKHLQRFHNYETDSNSNFASLLQSKNADFRLPKPLTQREIEDICSEIPIDTLSGIRDRAMIELLYCGLRNSECCNIKLNDISDHFVSIIGKGNKERVVPINKVAWKFTIEYLASRFETMPMLEQYGPLYTLRRLQEDLENQPVFVTTAGNQMYTRKLRSIVAAYADMAGIENVHPHRFRHSFATHVLDEGLGNLIALQDVLGHSDLATVKKYVLTTKVGRELVNSFHPRERRESK